MADGPTIEWRVKKLEDADEQRDRELDALRDREAERDKREGERDVKVDLVTSVMNRLAVAVLGAGTAVVGCAIWFIVKGGPH
jgi:hypothetical protein